MLMVDIPKFEELPYSVRKSPRKRWNYLADLLGDGSEDSGSSEPETQNQEQEVVTPTTRDISITVNDGSDPVEGVSVAIDEISGTTGAAGGCTLKNVADGEQTITATKEGYEEYSDTITVSENDTSFTISLTAVTPTPEVTPGET